MKLAVIPARGGSKRIPRKNVKPFGGLPMIAWSIRAAIASACFDRIIVSTDDEEITQVAKTYGAEVPFIRSAELSDDNTGTIAVVAHAIAWQNAHGITATDACCLYATAPFVQPSDIAQGYDVLKSSGADYAFSVTSYGFPIQRAIFITPEQRVGMFQPEHFNTRSQDLVESWHDAGQFYWGHAHAWLAHQPLFTQAAAPVPIPRYRVQDIDTPEDWERAEWLWKSMQLTKEKQHDIQN
jgi:pseudaminic acid cytidylyltransferase